MSKPTQQSAVPANAAEAMRLGLAVSTYHSDITGAMRRAAEEAFVAGGGHVEDLVVVEVPGAFELITACRALAERDDLDGIVALGCVIRGETRHDRAIVNAVANALSTIIVEAGIPIGFGVLTCENHAQAKARAGGTKGNKGEEAMNATILTVRAIHAALQNEDVD